MFDIEDFIGYWTLVNILCRNEEYELAYTFIRKQLIEETSRTPSIPIELDVVAVVMKLNKLNEYRELVQSYIRDRNPIDIVRTDFRKIFVRLGLPMNEIDLI